jgi:hypothetical protein
MARALGIGHLARALGIGHLAQALGMTEDNRVDTEEARRECSRGPRHRMGKVVHTGVVHIRRREGAGGTSVERRDNPTSNSTNRTDNVLVIQ